MVSIRQLLTDHHRALHSFRGAEWLLDQDISDSALEERIQWVYIQLILTISLGRHLQEMGFLARYVPFENNGRLLDLINICKHEELFTPGQIRWLQYFNHQANRAKHELSRL